MTIEDAELLDAPWKSLVEEVEWAEERLEKHEELERDREQAGLKTDMQRYLDGERITD